MPVCLHWRLLPLGENVPVGAAVLHGDTISTVWRVVADGVERAVLVIIGDILQDRCIPHEAKTTVLDLGEGRRKRYLQRGDMNKDASLFLDRSSTVGSVIEMTQTLDRLPVWPPDGSGI